MYKAKRYLCVAAAVQNTKCEIQNGYKIRISHTSVRVLKL